MIKTERLCIYLLILLVLALVSLAGEARGQATNVDLGAPLYWDMNVEVDVDIYGVWRSDTPCTDPTPAPITCGTFVQVATTPQSSDPVQWTEPGPIIFIQDYYYRVQACNTSLNCSAFSNELNVRWLNPNSPFPPSNFRGTVVAAGMLLDWDEAELNEHIVAYNVWKALRANRQGAHIGTVSESRRYLDRISERQGSERQGNRFYYVTAVNDDNIESLPAGPVVYSVNQGRN